MAAGQPCCLRVPEHRHQRGHVIDGDRPEQYPFPAQGGLVEEVRARGAAQMISHGRIVSGHRARRPPLIRLSVMRLSVM
ncbi:hypothetical protein ACM01_44325 [Streptomyces viridochromogenes]|uniref:Uncharacterized protein n=1 Tax=Streptomyces viridochromogenes TaxID=1938 RepID=A0A0J7YU57_STRVR|nr:hypothetical protein ACM01_44325 [Streptomyces viridochromogenes]KOG06755.1 hypothetical protein ADK36_45475 [Streptomyces viridochromogenes]KOG06843.1 hypothetical protein ADK35_44940 [Streptomyces viridochromogenes]